MPVSRPCSIPMTNRSVDNVKGDEGPRLIGETRRVASLRAMVGGVLNWNTQHKFRPNRLIVSVLLERISSHAKLLGAPALNCSLPSCFVYVG